MDAVRCGSLLGEEIAHTAADRRERCQVKSRQANLGGARVVKARIGGKVGVQALRKRRKPLNALRPLDKSDGPRNDEIQARIATSVDFVDQLPQRIETPLARVGAHALQGLHLIEHENQTGASGVAKNGQQPTKEMHCAERIEVALYG